MTPTNLSPEEQKQIRTLQRILDEQHFLIVCRDKRAGKPAVNEIIVDDWGDTLNFLNKLQGSALRVIGFASHDEFMNQLKKYLPHRAKLKQHTEQFYLVKVSAE